MRVYHQHPIVLFWSLLPVVAVSVLGSGLSMLTRTWFFMLMLTLPALLWLAWQVMRWWKLTVRIEGRQVTLHMLQGCVVVERIVPLGGPGGLRLRQNPLGHLLNYGTLRIEVFKEPVQIRYIAPFDMLRRQVDGKLPQSHMAAHP